MQEPKVTGIGGIFFKCKDPQALKAWYQQHLGIATDEYGCLFTFVSEDQPGQKGYLQWSPFPANTDYFKPSAKEFMINYRVQNLEGLIEKLKAAGIAMLDQLETYDYGKFIHLMDPEGNKIELWEPQDEGFSS